MLVLRKKPVGAFECELRDKNDHNIPYISDRPNGFGTPKKQDKSTILLEIISYLIVAGTLGTVLYLIINALILIAPIR